MWENNENLYTLWLFNIAMENGSFIIRGFMMIYLSKMVIFHSYVESLNGKSFGKIKIRPVFRQ
jgi:hypothetical protein